MSTEYFPGTQVPVKLPDVIVPSRDIPPILAALDSIALEGEDLPTPGEAGNEVNMDEMDDKTDPGMAAGEMDKDGEGKPAEGGGDAVMAELAKMVGVEPAMLEGVLRDVGMSAKQVLDMVKADPAALAALRKAVGKPAVTAKAM